jgi:hypothetical protein
MTLQEQKDGARRMVEMLIKEGFTPDEVLGCTLNATMVLADMVGAKCGYVSSETQSVLLSEAGKEQESLDHVMSQRDDLRKLTTERKLKEAQERFGNEARIEAGGNNVLQFPSNDTKH